MMFNQLGAEAQGRKEKARCSSRPASCNLPRRGEHLPSLSLCVSPEHYPPQPPPTPPPPSPLHLLSNIRAVPLYLTAQQSDPSGPLMSLLNQIRSLSSSIRLFSIFPFTPLFSAWLNPLLFLWKPPPTHHPHPHPPGPGLGFTCLCCRESESFLVRGVNFDSSRASV